MTLRRWMAAALPGLLLALASVSAHAAATADQQKAIRSACPGDFRANCSGVSPGGAEALQCLEKNLSVLTPACQAAVKAVSAPAAPAPAAASQPAAPPPAASTPPPPAASNPPPAAKSAAAAPSATPAPPPAKKSPPPAPVAKNPPPAPPPAVALNPVPPPMTPKQEARFVRQSCRQDYRKFCRMEPLSGGRALSCLRANAAALDPVCRYALMTLQK